LLAQILPQFDCLFLIALTLFGSLLGAEVFGMGLALFAEELVGDLEVSFFNDLLDHVGL